MCSHSFFRVFSCWVQRTERNVIQFAARFNTRSYRRCVLIARRALPWPCESLWPTSLVWKTILLPPGKKAHAHYVRSVLRAQLGGNAVPLRRISCSPTSTIHYLLLLLFLSIECVHVCIIVCAESFPLSVICLSNIITQLQQQQQQLQRISIIIVFICSRFKWQFYLRCAACVCVCVITPVGTVFYLF